MYEVYASEKGILLSLSSLLISDIYLRLSWFGAILGFITLFSYTLIKYRKLTLFKRYSVWLTALFIALTGIILSNRLAEKVKYQSLAELGVVPTQLIFTQTSDNEVFIQWKTEKAVIQFVRYRKEKKKWLTAVDDSGLIPKNLHRVHLTNLEKNSKYEIQIIYDEKKFTDYEGKKLEIILK